MPPIGDDDIDVDVELEPKAAKPAGNQNDDPPDDDAEPDDANADGDPEGEEPEPEELFEHEEGGKKFKIPAALKGSLLRQQDYSRRMGEVTTARAAIETEKAEAASWRKAEAADQLAVGQLAHLEERLKEFENVNWPAWFAREPAKAAAAQGLQTQLQNQRNTLKEQVAAGKARHETETKRETSERLRATREFAQAEIPGWTPAMDKELAKLAVDTGVKAEDLFAVMSPAVYKLLHLANVGRKYQEARAAKAKEAKRAKSDTTIVPLARVGDRRGGGAVNALSEKAPVGSWIEARNKQLRAKAR